LIDNTPTVFNCRYGITLILSLYRNWYFPCLHSCWFVLFHTWKSCLQPCRNSLHLENSNKNNYRLRLCKQTNCSSESCRHLRISTHTPSTSTIHWHQTTYSSIITHRGLNNISKFYWSRTSWLPYFTGPDKFSTGSQRNLPGTILYDVIAVTLITVVLAPTTPVISTAISPVKMSVSLINHIDVFCFVNF
jgi:hypothetical protein